jgi:hypothetical protein
VRAHVSLRIFTNNGQQAYGALSNGDGKFTIAPLPAGRYNVSVERAGFIDRPSAGIAPNATVNLQPGDKREDLKLTLTPTGAISGRVLTPAGEAVDGCNVSVEGDAGSVGGVTTDDQGQFRIGGLAPGKYRVQAAPASLPFPPEIRSDGTRDVHLARTWFPSTLDHKGAQRIQLAAAGDVTGVDIKLVETPIVTVSGKVTGLPEGRAFLQVQRTDGGGGTGTQINSDGTFRLWRLDPGKYTLVAMTQGNGPDRLQSATLDIEVGTADIERLELRMIAPFDIPGQLDFDDAGARQMPQAQQIRQGQQAAPASSRPSPVRRVMMRPADRNFGFSVGSNQQVEVGADDSFTLEKVPPGRYRVSVSWGPYVRAVRQGSIDTDGDILDVRNGPNGPLTLRLGSVRANISGVVTDSNGPARGVQVALLSRQPGMGFLSSAVTDKDGVYHLRSVAPGTYRLLAADSDIMMQVQRSQDADDFKDIVELIEVHAGDNLTQNLTRH